MLRTVTVTAERSGRWWVLEAPEAGAVSQCRCLSQADDEMREAIAYQLGVSADSFNIQVDVIPPQTYLAEMAAAETLRDEAERLGRASTAAKGRAAKTLAHDYGLSVRDIGQVMNISYQRAQQLVAA